MGWMQGFPPSADKTIRFTDPDFFTFPKLRWTVCHFRQLMPNVGVSKGSAGARPLPLALDPGLDSVRFTPLGADTTMTWNEAFAANYTDGIVVLHKGKLVYERYFGALKPEGQHIAMSVTKSFFGTIGAMLVAASKRHLIMVDGMAACAALLIASRIAESVTDYCVFCRSQTHHGLDRALGLFQASALLELGLDTTDGTGACLSWPLVHSAAALLTELSEEDVSQPAGMDAPVVQSLYDPSSPTIPGLP